MLVASAKGANGRQILVIGLSFANLDRFRAEPNDTYIRIEGEPVGVSADVILFSSRTEAEAAGMIESFIGKDTKVSISPKLKS
jgi:hypothetical protein